jgi:Arc/MetJ family transcription regulator
LLASKLASIDAYDPRMRTTLNIEDTLFARAQALSGLRDKTDVVREGLIALIARESAKRLAALGGSQSHLVAIPRRRSAF